MKKIEGRNAVVELLKGDRNVKEIIIQKSSKGERIKEIEKLAKKNRIPLKKANKKHFKQISESHSPQGVIARAEKVKFVDPLDIINFAHKKNEEPFIIILDQIQDPQNFGSIIRSAHSAGAHGIIFPKRRAAGLTPVVNKAASGAVEYIKLARVSNINYTIKSLKENGIWVTGTDAESSQLLYDVDYSDPTAIVIGNEGHGIRRLVRENCDFMVKIPMQGNLSSLNASVSAGIIMYEVVRQRILS
ncbi:MAG: 23S rRNA (guanosine(2251)-2'-O)-methyltransferase RlmB [Bacillota bacterium]